MSDFSDKTMSQTAHNSESLYSQDKCIHQLFEAQVEQNINAVAVICDRQSWTYRELNAKANQLANYLRKRGVKPEVRVGICAERSLDMVIAILGILKAGGAYVPLDPAYPKERLDFILKETKAPLLLTQKHLVEKFIQEEIQVVCLDADCDTIAQESEETPNTEVTIENLAYIMYTSGSTGKPKGVQITHANISHYIPAVSQVMQIQPEDLYLHVASFSFSSSVRQLMVPLFRGATSIIANSEQTKNPISLFELIQKQGVTIVDSVHSVWRYGLQALETLDQRHTEALTKSKLRTIVLSGDLPPVQIYKQLQDLFKERLDIFNVYGQAETIGNCAYSVPNDFDPERGYIYIPVGYPYSHNKAYILDENLEPVTPGEVGELYMGGACLARGYLNSLELNADKFISNPFNSDPLERLFKTGDLARYWSDGAIELLGRTDFQVKIRGMRVELGEIESALGQHPSIKEAVVIAAENEQKENHLVAYVVPNSSLSKITQTELRAYLDRKLPDYIVPSAFVLLDSLPLTPNGKIDRLALRSRKVINPELEAAYVKPQTDTEEIIATIWQEVLLLEYVGIHDNFFELGGHSLLMAQVHSKLSSILELSNILGQQLSIVELYQYPTIHLLADYLTHKQNPQLNSSKNHEKVQMGRSKKAALQQQRERRQKSKLG
ncbi:non-ribosomal peptide synthetase [Microcoleus asticus]|uniref:Linear gramicidin synthase subunit D n=1 Tax=Microcoleus asticus IPMA8 TaxID=2563858 RepID=A0ABX2CYQ6_9CYAN|nr:non-ribosomal peptide synthetase [Microcoleus asticus]NQE34740.1 Linear gramicidin synthase subunit D [Microcoleus asticus IPMA8]